MSWSAAIPEFLVALAVIFLPGAAILAAWRARLVVIVSAAPAISVALMSLSAMAAGFTAQTWTLAWLAVPALLIAAAGVAASLLTRTRPAWHRAELRVLGVWAVGIGASTVFMASPMMRALRSPTSFAQRFDNAFHLLGIHAVSIGDKASPLDFSFGYYYPAGWHEWAGLVSQITGAPATVAAQASTLALLFGVWPMALIWLCESVFRMRASGRMFAGALALSCTSFTLKLFDWGSLYANLFGIAVAPALLACCWELFTKRLDRAIAFLVLAAGVAAGVACAHPNAAFAVGAMVTPLACWRIAAITPLRRRVARLGDFRDSWWWAALCLVVIAGFYAFWIRSGLRLSGTQWVATMSVKDALKGAVLGTPMTPLPVVVLGVGCLVGIAVCLRQRHSYLAPYAIVTLIFVAAAAFPDGVARNLISGVFYNDLFRPAATLALVVIPIAAYGYQCFFEGISAHTDHLSRIAAAVIVAIGLAYGAATDNAMVREVRAVNKAFKTDTSSDILTPSELRMLRRLPDYVPEDATIVTNPWQGAGLAYVFANRDVTGYYMFQTLDPAVEYINLNLENVATTPQVCSALESENARYVLILEPHYISNGVDREPEFAGLDEVPDKPGFELIAQEGGSRLYKITACGLG